MKTEALSVVVVERQPLMLTALSAALSADGMRVLAEVTNHRLAIRSVQKFEPHLLLFSISTPSLPDLERISAIRYEFPNVLVMALITGEYRGQERMALDYGAHRVLTKATPRAKLISVLRKLSEKIPHPILTSHVPTGAVITP